MGRDPSLSLLICGKNSPIPSGEVWEGTPRSWQSSPRASGQGSPTLGLGRRGKDAPTVGRGGLKERDTVSPMTPYLWEAFPYSCPRKGCAVGSCGPGERGRGKGRPPLGEGREEA